MKRSGWIRFSILAASLVLGVAALLTGSFLRNREQAGGAGKLAPVLPEGAVGKIELKWGEHSVTLLRSGGEWTVRERQVPADPHRIAKLLEAVRNLRPLKQLVPVSDAMLSRLRLTEKGRIPGMRMTIRDPEGRVLYDLMMGKLFFLPQELPSAHGSRPVPDGRYMAKIGPDGKPVPFLTSATLEEFLPLPGAWIRLPLFDAPERTFQIRFISGTPEGSWMGARNSFASNFEFLIPVGGHRVSVRIVREIFHTLSAPYAMDIITPAQAGELKPAGILELKDDAGLVRRLRFFRYGKNDAQICCRAESAAGKNSAGAVSVEAAKKAVLFRETAKDHLYVIHPKIYRLLTEIPEEKRKK